MARFGRPAAAVGVMAVIIAVLFVLCTPRSTSRRSAGDGGRARGGAALRPAPADRRAVRVLVLDFDPVIADSGRRLMHEAFGWMDPRRLAAEYARDITDASGGHVRFDIVEWRTIDAFPPKRDGFRYTATTYAECLANDERCHDPDRLDYEGVISRYGVPPLIDYRTVDEVWLFGGPHFGYFESAMAGPGAFEINGDALPNVRSGRAFAIMGFNTERGTAEMLHNFCHRAEATMAHVYGGWQAESLTTPWARFAANAHQSGGRAGVGSCHYPPNATSDYDYANPRAVDSDADDWLSYPRLTGARSRVTAESWGGPDHHRQYMRWWLSRLPRVDGEGPDGKLNNWWTYVIEFDSLLIGKDRR